MKFPLRFTPGAETPVLSQSLTLEELTDPSGLTKATLSPDGRHTTIVLIHGRPIDRNQWEWDAEVQLLADRGYLVFPPQFRRSSGFGRTFQEAGYGEWGRAMQDDITDGVRHLIRKGEADPQRICTVGASYSRYAALWGMVKMPKPYQCRVSFAGVTNIAYTFSYWSDRTFNKLAGRC